MRVEVETLSVFSFSLTSYSQAICDRIYGIFRLTSCSQFCELAASSKGGFLLPREEKWGKTRSFPPLPVSLQEKSTLTDAEFEEIVQIVLRKSFQECLGMALVKDRVSVR